MSQDFHLHGRVALVTGSSKGLGKAMAFALGKAGARVALNYANDQAWAERTFAEFRALGYEGALFRANVTDEHEVNHMVADIERTLGAVHTLVVNATPKQPLKPIEEYDWAFYQSMLDFFVKSPYLLTRAVLPAMKQRKAGRIINITSEVFARGVGNFSAYVAAKGAQTGWTRSMATELAPWHVTVNAVAPGWIPVERHADDPQHEMDAYERLIPMGQFGTPEDVGGAVVFLSSDASRFVTGQSIHVNGGMTVF
jgi:3-oxoacyl-[acyl-carrier protein] reductase